MWNHVPGVREKATKEGIKWKPFRGLEMRDLIALLYLTSLFNEPGAASRSVGGIR